MKKYPFLCVILLSINVNAVHVNPQGTGDVQLIPYYTVNNTLNSLVTVTNTKETSKAIKVNIREGLNGYAVLSYNVYLSAYDTWAFALIPSTSTVDGFMGQPTVMQGSNDTSCAPFLNKNGEEFLTTNLVDGPQNLSRVREGFIEIIEMGELVGEPIALVHHGSNGLPSGCQEIEAAWETGGMWDEASGGNLTNNLSPATGGLMAEANVINVAEGINYSIPAVALADFFADNSINHSRPDDSSLSLDAAAAIATVVTEDKFYQLSFNSGVDAVSAVLMADELIGAYALDSIVGGQSESVIVQPTRRFYVNGGVLNSQSPYNPNLDVLNCPDSFYGGTELELILNDRESQSNVHGGVSLGAPIEREPDATICGSVSVHRFLLHGSDGSEFGITGSNNIQSIVPPPTYVTESGFFNIKFEDVRPLRGADINTSTSVEIMGLPMIGITLQQFTNVGAAEGLLAQYGGAHKVRSKVRVIEQN